MLSLLLYLNIPDLINKICSEYKISTSRELKGSYTTVRVMYCGTFYLQEESPKALKLVLYCRVIADRICGQQTHMLTQPLFPFFDIFMDINRMFARMIKETLTQLALSNCTKREGEEAGQVCGWVQHVFALKCTVLIIIIIKKGGVKRINYSH